MREGCKVQLNLFKRVFIFLCVIFISNAWASHSGMVFSLDVIRHGDRTPAKMLPVETHVWKEGLGQLTARGMHQEYELGTRCKKRYAALLPGHYEADRLYVRSSDFDRTLMSAESFLMGLYPLGTGPLLREGSAALPSRYQPIPIHSVPKTQDTLLLADSNEPQKLKALFEKYSYSREEWKQKTKAVEPSFDRWSELTGVKIHHLHDLISVADALYIDSLYHVPLPKGMKQQEADKIIDAGRWALAAEFAPYEVGEATTRPLLSMIQDYLKKAAEGSKLKFVLISSHDTTILMFLSILHASLDTVPPYASDLAISLFKDDKEQYTVRVMFNEKPVLIPGCAKKSVCTLDEFGRL